MTDNMINLVLAIISFYVVYIKLTTNRKIRKLELLLQGEETARLSNEHQMDEWRDKISIHIDQLLKDNEVLENLESRLSEVEDDIRVYLNGDDTSGSWDGAVLSVVHQDLIDRESELMEVIKQRLNAA